MDLDLDLDLKIWVDLDLYLDLNFTGFARHWTVILQLLGVKLPVQDSSLFWCFVVNEFMSMKTSRLVHRSFHTMG